MNNCPCLFEDSIRVRGKVITYEDIEKLLDLYSQQEYDTLVDVKILFFDGERLHSKTREIFNDTIFRNKNIRSIELGIRWGKYKIYEYDMLVYGEINAAFNKDYLTADSTIRIQSNDKEMQAYLYRRISEIISSMKKQGILHFLGYLPVMPFMIPFSFWAGINFGETIFNKLQLDNIISPFMSIAGVIIFLTAYILIIRLYPLNQIIIGKHDSNNLLKKLLKSIGRIFILSPITDKINEWLWK